MEQPQPASQPEFQETAAPAPPSPTRKTTFQLTFDPFWLLGGILLVTVAVFWRTLGYDYVNWDDSYFTYENPWVVRGLSWESVKGIFTTPVLRGYAPLTVLSFAAEFEFFGKNATVHHFNNLLLHLINTWLVWRIFSKLGLQTLSVAFITFLFALHPMHVESVAWVSERKDVLFGALFLGASERYLAWLESERTSTRDLVLVYVLFALSLFAKIQSVTLPASLLLFDYYLLRPLKWKLIWEKLPLFLLSLAIGAMGIYFLQTEPGHNVKPLFFFHERLTIGAWSFTVYLMKLLVPYEMVTLYPFPYSGQLPGRFYIGFAVWAAYAYVLWRAFRADNRAVVAGLLYFVVNVFFVLQIIDGGQGFKADHYTYIPYLGLFWALAWGIEHLAARGQGSKAYPLTALWLVALLYVAYQQVAVWRNSYTLWTHEIRYYKGPKQYRSRAKFLFEKKQYQLAFADINRAIQYKSDDIDLFVKRAFIYSMYNKPAAAYNDMALVVKKFPNNAPARVKLVEYGVRANVITDSAALGHLDRAIKLQPRLPSAYRYRYLAYLRTDQPVKALADADTYLTLRPRNPAMHLARAMALEKLDRNDEALAAINKAIALDGRRRGFYAERAKIYLALNDKPNALSDLRRVQRMGGRVSPGLLEKAGAQAQKSAEQPEKAPTE